MNLQRISAIFEKDIKDFMKNTMLLVMPIIPIILAVMYSRLGGDEAIPLEMVYLIVGVTFSSVTAICMMMMMAEENEKKTLRGLILSPASILDIIVGKSMVTGLLTLITLILSLLIIGIEPFLSIRAVIGLILLFLFFLLIGIGIGLVVKSVATTNVYSLPVMFLFGFTPMIEFLRLGEDSLAIKIANTFPIPQLISMHDTDSWLPLGIVTLWVIGAGVFVYFCFIKVTKDK